MIRCFIGLGSNQNNPVNQLRHALEAMANWDECHLLRCSSFYQSKPLGPQDQPDFINAVAELHTHLEPLQLLDRLQQQEQEQGRVKLRHWGERCIDLDLLLYGDTLYQDERLTIPHAQLDLREFVLVPLAEIAPRLVLPDGRKVADLAAPLLSRLTQLSEPVIDL